MAHGCTQFWSGPAARLVGALGDPDAGGAGRACTLASEPAYRALCAARGDVCDALDALCVPPPRWVGGGGEPPELRGAALALSGALAADRADPAAAHDLVGRGWLATGAAVPEAVAAARRLLIALDRAVSGP